MKFCEKERAIACLKLAIELAGDGGMTPFTDKEYELMDNLIKEMETYAEEKNIPIMQKKGIDFLMLLYK